MTVSGPGWEVEHAYGERVHILDNTYLLTLLACLSGKDAGHPELPALIGLPLPFRGFDSLMGK